MSNNFYLITSNNWESFWTYLPTLKSDVINGRSLRCKMTWFWIWWPDVRSDIKCTKFFLKKSSYNIMKIEKRHLEKKQTHKKNNATSEHISPHFAIFGFAIVLPIEHTVWVLLFYNISNRNRIEITCLMQNHIKTFRIKCRTTVNKQRPEKSM